MLLKRLQASLPEHLHPVINSLEGAGIKTTENIIFTPPTVLLDHVRDVEEHELHELVERCIRLTAPASVTGEDELEREEGLSVDKVGWGVNGLDGLLGDWDGRGVMEICGPQKVGRSLLVLHMVLQYLVQNDQATCRWLDTDGSFAPARAQSILALWSISSPGPILERLLVSPCYDVEPDITNALSAIDDKTRFLVIDSITPLLRDNLIGSGSQGHASMVNLLHELSEIAHQRGLCVLTTNSTASSKPSNPLSHFTATDVKPALGTDFTYFADLTLLVQSTGKIFGEIDEGERDRVWKAPGLRGVVEVLKSRVSPSGRWAVFETDGISLMDVAPAPADDERTIRMSAGHDTGRPAYGALRDTLV